MVVRFAATLAALAVAAGTFEADRHLRGSHPAAGTFEADRPGTCCTLEPQTRLTWSAFKLQTEVAGNMSQGRPVVVPCGHEVTMDESIEVKGLQVLGSLTFQDGVDIDILTDYVFVCGRFSIGSPERRHESKVEITLRKGQTSEFTWHQGPHGPKNFGIAPFVTYGGALYIRGAQCDRTVWTRLQQTVAPISDATSNIARGKAATQSSYQRRRTHKWSDKRGTDGNTHWKWGSVLTDKETNPSWSVTLGQEHVEKVVVVHAKRSSKALSQARVVVSDEVCQRGSLCSGHVCPHKRSFRKGRSYAEEFDCDGAAGSRIHLQLEGEARLWFGEMEVYRAIAESLYDLQLPASAAVAWQAGDRLVVAPSGRSSSEYDHDLHVVGIAGDVVQVRGHMKYAHAGCDTTSAQCWRAAEVATLERNVKILGQEGCEASNSCGHFMLAHTNTGHICGAQFQRLGQKLREGRYPLHIHMAGDAPDIVVKNNVLAWNQQRGLVMHGVNQMLAESNVIYRSNGHLVMLEDAIEMKNRIRYNLAMHPSSLRFDCSHSHDNTFLCPARSDHSPNAFWISNPHNYYEGNVGIAASAAFFMETRHVFGLTRRKYPAEIRRAGLGSGKIKGRVMLLNFSHNLAHSSGLGMGNYPMAGNPDGSAMYYDHFTCWSCGNGQAGRGARFIFNNSRLLDCSNALVSGIVRDKIRVYNSQLTGENRTDYMSRGRRIVSAPMVFKKVGLTSRKRLTGDFWIDEVTKAWTSAHGGYKWAALRKLGGGIGVLFE